MERHLLRHRVKPGALKVAAISSSLGRFTIEEVDFAKSLARQCQLPPGICTITEDLVMLPMAMIREAKRRKRVGQPFDLETLQDWAVHDEDCADYISRRSAEHVGFASAVVAKAIELLES